VPRNSAQLYDEYPFPNLPVPASQPERLATIAHLRGFKPRDVAEARVLELGCAGGQNLVPVAERHPGASCLGIDQSARQIDMANQLVGDLHLANIEFRQQDFAQLPADLGSFDYIIAQAVYSWVDADQRDQLLAVIARHLAPEGIAFVSYNVYPGWHVHDMLRAMMLYDARDARTADEMIAAARKLLGFLNNSLADENPFSSTVKPQIARLIAQSDAYLLHDHLAEVNEPVYYRQFAAHARRHGLAPAGDCVLGLRFSDYLSPETEQRLATITTDVAEKEQYRDIVRNRAIRQTLLCHEGLSLTRLPRPEMLEGLYFASNLAPENSEVNLQADQVERFVSPRGLRISTALPLIKAALAHLGAIWPDFVSLESLHAAASARLEARGGPLSPATDGDIGRLRDNLLQCCLGDLVELRRHPAPFTAAVSARPTASPLARWQAERGDVATNRSHEAMRLEYFERHMLPLLDGTRDLPSLVEELTAQAASGRFVIFDQQQLVQSPEQTRKSLDIALPETLAQLARSAFLVA
jgi:methyltransferase-like protein/2-polyprenyl-3-methyl-5-hydroxy-6-metoxy-1,4-benzoquinol methylase